MIKEFREFAVKGSVVDLAVGVVVGAAFGGIVTALVNNIIMPPIGLLVHGVDFSNLFVVLKAGSSIPVNGTLKAAQDVNAVTLNYGLFINAVINFVIVAGAMFFVVQAIGRLRLKHEEEPAAPSKQELLLEEIRDLLKARK